MMDFYEVLDQVVVLLKQRGRASYRALKLQFKLDDDYLEVLKDELVKVHKLAVDEDGEILIWTGGDTESIPSPAQSMHQGDETESRFHALLPTVIAFLQVEGRVTYRTLKHAFSLNDRLLTEIREELQFRRLAIDEGGNGLVWTGKAQPNVTLAVSEPSQQATRDIAEVTPPVTPPMSSLVTEKETQANEPTALPEPLHTDTSPDELANVPEPTRNAPDAERRQLTVMFCDLVGSTDLSGRLDPEDLREVVRAYQETAAEVIERYEGHIAQYLGDGLLVYHGFPAAHENDAERAVHTGLEIPEAIARLNTRLETDYGVQLAVRIGIHTGPVVVGEMGGGDRHENLALGETPNISARLEGLAQPNTAVISPVTAQLVQRSFVLEELGLHELKGVTAPMMLYAVIASRETDYDDHESMLSGGFDALVGRDEEIGLLLRRWEQSKESQGQVVLISGEAGLGKSSLVEGLRAHVHQEGYTRIAFRCSPYTANSAMHPVIEHVQRVLGWERDDSAEAKRGKLEQALEGTSLPVEETVPLLAALLSLPMPEDRYPALTLSPQRQRQLTQDALVAWMLEEAERQPVLAVWEDLHWGDPSTMELLGLFIEQTPTVPMLNVLAYRPEFVPPWSMQSHMTPITLNRLERTHIEALVRRLAGGKKLPTEVVTHVVTKTDGVPLYVEELTKMLLESDLLQEEAEAYILTGPLSSASIPATLQDSLMARLDRLPEVREVAQLGAVLGREFDYEVIQALAVMDESTLQKGLSQLVNNELLYQRGRIPRAKFIFRHVLIRDAAYQSMLRRTRQQYHKQVALLLEAQFHDLVEVEPELLAHHYTEARLHEQAVGYWHQTALRAQEHSAHHEAIHHLTQEINLLSMLPDSSENALRELDAQLALASSLGSVNGWATPVVEQPHTRARELCEQLGDTSKLYSVLLGQHPFYLVRADFQTAQELASQRFQIAQESQNSFLLFQSHMMHGHIDVHLGALMQARRHFELGIDAYYSQQPAPPITLTGGQDPRMFTRSWLAMTLWLLGYPEQSTRQIKESLDIAQEFAAPSNLISAFGYANWLFVFQRNPIMAQELSQKVWALASEHGFAQHLAQGKIRLGLEQIEQGDKSSGEDLVHQGLKAYRKTGALARVPMFLGQLASAYNIVGKPEKGLTALAEALEVSEQTGEHWWDAEIQRLKGEFLLQQSSNNSEETESCFQQAIAIAQNQSAKSWELRAATSLAKLWQSQGKVAEAQDLLAPIYNWFTEGFDTADLKDAKAFLDELA